MIANVMEGATADNALSVPIVSYNRRYSDKVSLTAKDTEANGFGEDLDLPDSVASPVSASEKNTALPRWAARLDAYRRPKEQKDPDSEEGLEFNASDFL